MEHTKVEFIVKMKDNKTMDTKNAINEMTGIMARFISLVGKKLPDDVWAKLNKLRVIETEPLPKTIYDTMFRNQELALELNRPSCQDTGVLQFLVKSGAGFPLLGWLEKILTDAVLQATTDAPLRHNSVEAFDEYNT